MALKAIYKDKAEIPEQYQELYAEKGGQFELSGIEGIKTEADVLRLNEALRKERNDHAQAKEKLRAWGEHSPDDVLAKLDRLSELEAAGGGKMDDEKIEKLLEARLRSKLSPVEREKQKLLEQLTVATQEITTYKERDRQRKIHDAIRAAASEARIVATAIDDALVLAERVFDVDEDGRVTVRDQVGFTPGIDPASWLSELQPKRPHWWPESVGGGAKGGKGGGFADNPWSADNWNKTKQGQIYTENPQRAEQMARAAGVEVFAVKPRAKAA